MKESLCSYKIQGINAPTCSKGVLPFTRTKVVRNGFTGKCKHHVNTYQRYDKSYTKSILEHDLSRLDQCCKLFILTFCIIKPQKEGLVDLIKRPNYLLHILKDDLSPQTKQANLSFSLMRR